MIKTNKNPRSNIVPVTFLALMTLALCGGCAPVGGGTLEAFFREMLLSATAALAL